MTSLAGKIPQILGFLALFVDLIKMALVASPTLLPAVGGTFPRLPAVDSG